MAGNFHIGDEVCVLYAGRSITFTVDDICYPSNLAHPALFTGRGQPWWPAERLDYALPPEKQDWLKRAERRMYALSFAAEEARGIMAEAIDLKMPPSILAWLFKELREAKSKVEPGVLTGV